MCGFGIASLFFFSLSTALKLGCLQNMIKVSLLKVVSLFVINYLSNSCTLFQQNQNCQLIRLKAKIGNLRDWRYDSACYRSMRS